MCGYGYTVAGGPLASFFASDLIHRLFHADKIGEGTVFHYAHTLQYFALDVYAYDIAAPGQGCTGEPVEEEETETAAAASSSATVSATSSATTASSTATAEAASTTEATTTTDAAESTTESATESAESVSHV
jgi:hypothetical protein